MGTLAGERSQVGNQQSDIVEGKGSLVGDQQSDIVEGKGSQVGNNQSDTVEEKGSLVGNHRSDITEGKGILDGDGSAVSKKDGSLVGKERMERKEKESGEDGGQLRRERLESGSLEAEGVGGRGRNIGQRRSPRLHKQAAVTVGREDGRPHPRFFVEDDLLFERSGPGLDQVKICVPEGKIDAVIDEFHKSPRAGHPSIKRTTEAIKTAFTFPDLNSRVLEAVKKCYECQTNKEQHHKEYGQLTSIYSPPQVFDTLGIDFITGLVPAGDQRFDAITVVADKFSKFAVFYPSKTTDSAKVTADRFLIHVYPWTGIPRRFISDRDVRFTSEFWQGLTARLDIKHGMSAAYHPQTDGQVERLNQQLGALLRHTVAIDQHDWPAMLPSAMMAYNAQVHETTRETPYKVVFARSPRVFPLMEVLNEVRNREGKTASGAITDLGSLLAFHADVQDRIVRAQQRQSEEYDQRHLTWIPKVGEWVLVRAEHYKLRLDPTQRARTKLAPKLMGPFRVVEVIRPGTCRLDIPTWFKAHPVLPVQALERFHGDPTTVTPRPLIGTTEEGSRPERRVSAFLGRRPTQYIDGQRFDYLVKWAGDIAPTWQCDQRLPGMHWARRDFSQRIKAEKGVSRLARGKEWVLGIAEERAQELKDMEMGTKE